MRVLGSILVAAALVLTGCGSSSPSEKAEKRVENINAKGEEIQRINIALDQDYNILIVVARGKSFPVEINNIEDLTQEDLDHLKAEFNRSLRLARDAQRIAKNDGVGLTDDGSYIVSQVTTRAPQYLTIISKEESRRRTADARPQGEFSNFSSLDEEAI